MARRNFYTISGAAIVASAVLALTGSAFAFTNPPGNPPSGSGAIQTDASNRVGIGGAPTSKVSVNNGTLQLTGSAQTAPVSGSGLELFYDGSSGFIYSYNRTAPGYLPLELRGSTVNLNSAGGTGLLINASNNVGIGTASPGQKLDVQGGSINTSGSIMTGGVARMSNTGVLTNTTWSGTTIAMSVGGTGATNAATARSNLGAAVSGVNSDITSLTGLTTPISETRGGTAQSNYATGDMLYAWNTNALTRRAIGAEGQVLTASGGAPVWADAAGDITGVTAGTGLTGGGTSGSVTLNLATPVAATNGGTSQTTYAAGDLLYASAANTLAKRAIGAAGQVLTVSGGVPTWATPSTGITSLNAQTGATQTFANDTNVTITSSANTHTLGWTGTLAVARGGTGAATAADARILLGAAASGVNSDITSLTGLTTDLSVAQGGTGLSNSGTTGNVLTSDGVGWVSQAPAGDITGVTAGTGLTGGGTSGSVTLNLATPVAATNGGTSQTTYAAGDLLYASAANTLAKRAIGAAGQVLTVSGGVPAWATPSSGVTSLNAQTGGTQTFANDTNVTVTSSVNTHTLGWSGTLSLARGGTGASTASAARSNLGAAASGANSDITSLSGLTTGLSATQGGTAQTNYAAGDLLYASALNTLAKRAIGTAGQVLTVSGGVPTWANATGDITDVNAGTGLTGGGTSGSVTLNLATPVAATNGGTSQTTYAAGDLLYASAANTLAKRAIGAAGQVLTVSGGVPTWATPSSSGEANTASNVGVGGVGVFKQKTGVNLEFKNVNAASGKVSVANDATNNEIDVDVVESALTLGNLSGTLPISKGGTGSTDGSITGTGALTFAAGGTNQNVTLTPSGTGNVTLNGSVSIGSGLTVGSSLSASWSQFNAPPSTPATINAKAFSGLPIASFFDTANTYAVAQIGENGDVTIRRPSAGNAIVVQNSGGSSNFVVTDAGTVTAGAWQGSAVGAAYGGTGATSLTANSVLLGNGTAAVQTVAPGTSGNVLTSNGTTWASQAPAGTPPSYTLLRVWAPDSSGLVTAACPSGKKVVGGGCAGGYNNCRLRDSLPTSPTLGDTSEGWYCTFWQRGSDAMCGGPNQRAYVICM